jgi:hypothetical protein
MRFVISILAIFLSLSAMANEPIQVKLPKKGLYLVTVYGESQCRFLDFVIVPKMSSYTEVEAQIEIIGHNGPVATMCIPDLNTARGVIQVNGPVVMKITVQDHLSNMFKDIAAIKVKELK